MVLGTSLNKNYYICVVSSGMCEKDKVSDYPQSSDFKKVNLLKVPLANIEQKSLNSRLNFPQNA